MTLQEKKEWIKSHGSGIVRSEFDFSTLQHFIRWQTNTGMGFIAVSDDEPGAYDNIFSDIVETLYIRCVNNIS